MYIQCTYKAMTVAELCLLLKVFDDDAEVKIATGDDALQIVNITSGVDHDGVYVRLEG